MLNTEIIDGIATVTIDQKDRGLNVISTALSKALDECISGLAVDPAVTGIILTSGKSSFVVGADLAEICEFIALGPQQGRPDLTLPSNQIRRMETCGKPIVAALPGTALGGGLELALGCHHRIAADTPDAVFGLPEVGLGLLPGAGGTQRIPRLIGLEPALKLLTAGKPVSAAEAKKLGFIDAVVPADDLLASARKALVEGRVGAKQPWDEKGLRPKGTPINSFEAFNTFIYANAGVAGTAGPYQPAAAAILSTVYEGIRLPMDRALTVESQYFAHLLDSHAAKGLIESRFFLRNRMSKRGMRKANAEDATQAALAAKMREAISNEAKAIVAEGQGANVVRNAALRIGLPAPIAPEVVTGEMPGDAKMLDQIGKRLLNAAAKSVTAEADQDLTSLVAIDLAGFPEWTGGPALWAKAQN